MTNCLLCGEPVSEGHKYCPDTSPLHKKEWERGERLVLRSLRNMGGMWREMVIAALRAAGGQETG